MFNSQKYCQMYIISQLYYYQDRAKSIMGNAPLKPGQILSLPGRVLKKLLCASSVNCSSSTVEMLECVGLFSRLHIMGRQI